MIDDEMFFTGRWRVLEAWMLSDEDWVEVVLTRGTVFDFLPYGIVREYDSGVLVAEMDYDYFPQAGKLYFHATGELGKYYNVIEHDVERIDANEARLTFDYRAAYENGCAKVKFRIKRIEAVLTGGFSIENSN